MRWPLFTITTAFALYSGAANAGCKDEVAAAFEKQRTSPAFRVQMSQPAPAGEISMTVDYLPPDRMMQSVNGPGMPSEQQTLVVGTRAFSGTAGAWQELLPQFSQSVVANVKSAIGQSQPNLGDFDCLGTVPFEGKNYLGYRTKPAPAVDGNKDAIARTLYIDAATGLPAFNVVAPISASEPAVMKAVYSYPTDIVIEAPANAPVQGTK